MTGVAVAVERVRQVFGTASDPVVALDDISFSIAPGEFTALLGPSGCGKSTLLLAIAGLARTTAGRITIDDRPVTRPRTDLGIVFQEPFLMEWRSVLRNVMLQAELRGLDRAASETRARALLERVGLGEFQHRMPHELSGGMRQRTAICRALLHDPPLLLMDEPFGALDALTRDDLNLELQQIWLRSPKTVIFVTHSIAEAVLLADRVIILSPRPGRIADIIAVDLPRPRRLAMRETPAFGAYASRIRAVFTSLGVMRAEPA